MKGPSQPTQEFLRPPPDLSLSSFSGIQTSPLPTIPSIPMYQPNNNFPMFQSNYNTKPQNSQSLLSLLLRG